MKKQDEWLIAVTAGRWQRHSIREAKLAGLKVLAIDADPDAEGFADADQVLNINIADHNAVIQLVRNLQINICGAVSFVSDAGMVLAAKIREAFDLPGIRSELSQRLLDKSIQRRIWRESGVSGPEWKVFNDPEQTLEAILATGFPLIIKPTDSSGSRGVTKLESEQDDLADAISRAFQFSKSGEVLLESYMDGTEFTVETFGVDGKIHVLAVTEKKKVEGTRGTVARELATSERDVKVLENIKNTVVTAFISLEYVEGPGHAEVILKKDGSVGLIEVGGRGGGFMVFDRFVPLVSDVNIARLTALQAVGKAVELTDYKTGAAVLRFFPSTPGLLKSISGIEQANRIDGVEVGSFVKVGERFSRAAADGDRLGYILSHAESPFLAQALADKAERLVNFEIGD